MDAPTSRDDTPDTDVMPTAQQTNEAMTDNSRNQIIKVLSWDVGIVNLAYCVLDQNHKIYHWGVVDVLGDSETKRVSPDTLTNLVFDKLDRLPPEIAEVD